MNFTKWPHLDQGGPGIPADEVIQKYIDDEGFQCSGEIEEMKSNIEELTRMVQLLFNTLPDDKQESMAAVLGYERKKNG